MRKNSTSCTMRGIFTLAFILLSIVSYPQIDTMTFTFKEFYEDETIYNLPTSDGGLIAAGQVSSGNEQGIVLKKFDNSGEILWSNLPSLLTNSGQDFIEDIKLLSNEDILVSIRYTSCDAGSGWYYARVSGIDGSYLWSDHLEDITYAEPINIELASDNGFWAEYAGTFYLFNEQSIITDTLVTTTAYSHYSVDTINNTDLILLC